MRNDECKPDWYAVAVNETGHWNIADEDRRYISKILGVYFYDAREYTYCCELTPSYYLRSLGSVILFESDTPDDVRDDLVNKYETYNGEDCYMHVADVKAIGDEWKRHFGEVTDTNVEREKEEEYVREYYQGNCPF